LKKIAHIINPVLVNKTSDLYLAQPVTFATMSTARDFARDKVAVQLYTAQYTEDRPIVPPDFRMTPDLERSVLDAGTFRKKRKLPFIKDILARLFDAAHEADYMIYTNVDIGLMPQFYLVVKEFIEEGYDAFVINRRTISKQHQSIGDIPFMYSELGESHPGWDCFVFRRDAYPAFVLGDICVGANLIGTVLLFNLLCTAENFMEFKDEHLTFHIGDDMKWKSGGYSDYAAHNIRQTEKVLAELKTKYGSIDGGGRYSYLFTFIQNLKEDLEKGKGDEVQGLSAETLTMAEKTTFSPVHTREQLSVGDEPTEKDSQPRVLCITGMARSGTSLVTRMLNIMGLDLGLEDNLILQTDYNVKGCWEHKFLLEISDAIIAALGWPGLQNPDWPNSPSVASMTAGARAIIKKDFGGSQFWGWKDDRCSVTLPFWQKIIPQLECIICVRNPLDVAKSLLKQNWVVSLEEGIYRWLILMSSAICNTRGRRRLVVFFDDFFGEEWKTAVRRLAEFLGPAHVGKLPEYEKEISSFIKRDLQHHRTTMGALLDNAEIPYAAKHFFFVLDSYVKNRKVVGFSEAGSDPDEVLDTIAAHVNAGAFLFNQRFLELALKNEEIKTLTNLLNDPDGQIEALTGLLNERDKQIETLTSLLKEHNGQIEALSDFLKERDQRIEELLNSLSWKMTAPLRRAYEILNIGSKGSK
jgi:hypothetical protein